MNRLKKLFSDYVREKLTVQEKEIIDLWFEEKGKSSVDSVTDDEADRFSRQAWEQFLSNQKRPVLDQCRKPWVVYGLTTAAAVALLLILLNYPLNNPGADGYLEEERLTAEATIARQFVTEGNMKKITLSDGSVIHMNRETIISLRKGKFNAYTREVWLEEGEAFFEVAKDRGRPFIVHTMDGVSTQVLGTSFNIKAYSQLEEQVVSVKTGQVQVSNKTGKKVLLDVNNKATFHAATQELSIGMTDGTGAADWRSGRIILEHVKMKELAFRLRQYYDVEVENNAISEEMEIYTSFHMDTPLEHVANNIANIFGVSYEIANSVVYFF